MGLSLSDCAKKNNPPAENIVTIGYVGALTGELAHYGKDEENGVRLAIDDLNAQKILIAGKLIHFKIQSEDDQADPRHATNAAQHLVDANVNAVIGHTTSSTTLPASIIYNRAGIPLLAPAVTNPKYTQQGFPYTFRLIANDIQQGQTLANIAVQHFGAKQIAIIDDRSAYGVGMADEFEKYLKTLNGNLIARESASDKETDFNAILTRIKSKSPDLIFFAGNDGQAAAMLQQMRNLGITAQYIAGDGVHTPEFIKLAGKDAEGVVTTLPGLPLERMRQGSFFKQRFEQKYGPVQLYAPYYYDATQIIAKAMQMAGSTDPKIYAPELKKTNYAGVTNQIQFDPQGDLKVGKITVYQVKNGEWVELPPQKSSSQTSLTSAVNIIK
ncbi:MAG: branched-chain amino acid ABC transporter substrate-binding protein [Gammaproteobacteria bacterium]|nr:branched-chain amino acid ABC transporter substrate-binding protein [Gammaproteobacteria bacterium]